MILFTNGCSWTWGGGLSPWFTKDNKVDDNLRKTLVWPHHLGQLINASQVVNLGLGCGSNQRTVRTTFDWFMHEYKKDEKVIAVIQITDPARYEYYVSENIDDFTSEPLRWAKMTPSAGISHHEPEETFIANKNVRLSSYTTIEGMYKIITDCSALSYLFKKHNVEYYFFTGATTFSRFYPSEYKNYLANLPCLDMLNLWAYERISKTDGHPSILGHKQLAEHIYNAIRPSTGL